MGPSISVRPNLGSDFGYSLTKKQEALPAFCICARISWPPSKEQSEKNANLPICSSGVFGCYNNRSLLRAVCIVATCGQFPYIESEGYPGG